MGLGAEYIHLAPIPRSWVGDIRKIDIDTMIHSSTPEVGIPSPKPPLVGGLRDKLGFDQFGLDMLLALG